MNAIYKIIQNKKISMSSDTDLRYFFKNNARRIHRSLSGTTIINRYFRKIKKNSPISKTNLSIFSLFLLKLKPILLLITSALMMVESTNISLRNKI